jgi:hypothetical protein
MVPEAVLSQVSDATMNTVTAIVLGSRAGMMRARQGVTRVSTENIRAEN